MMTKNTTELLEMVHQLNATQEADCSAAEEQAISTIVGCVGEQEQRAFARMLVQYWKDIPKGMEHVPPEIRHRAREEAEYGGIPEDILCMAWLVFDGPDFNSVMGRTKD